MKWIWNQFGVHGLNIWQWGQGAAADGGAPPAGPAARRTVVMIYYD